MSSKLEFSGLLEIVCKLGYITFLPGWVCGVAAGPIRIRYCLHRDFYPRLCAPLYSWRVLGILARKADNKVIVYNVSNSLCMFIGRLERGFAKTSDPIEIHRVVCARIFLLFSGRFLISLHVQYSHTYRECVGQVTRNVVIYFTIKGFDFAM